MNVHLPALSRRRFLTATSAAMAAALAGQMRLAACAIAGVQNNPHGAFLLANGNAGEIEKARPHWNYYNIFILKSDQASHLQQIRAANPTAKILTYREMAVTYSSSYEYDPVSHTDTFPQSGGVGYAEAQSHPDWFATVSGRPVQWEDAPQRWQMAVGNSGYQTAWAQRVIETVVTDGWDGVFIDDVNDRYHNHITPALDQYPDDPAYALAMRSFVDRVAPMITGVGKLCVINLSTVYGTKNGETELERRRRDCAAASGVMIEKFMGYYDEKAPPDGRGSHVLPFENGWHNSHFFKVKDVIDAGKIALPASYGTLDQVDGLAYARASFLLAWSGPADASSFGWQLPDGTPADSLSDPYSAIWTKAFGRPSGPYITIPGTTVNNYGVYRRDFAKGVVVVNPTNRSWTFSLGGDYKDLVTGATVSAVTLASTRAFLGSPV